MNFQASSVQSLKHRSRKSCFQNAFVLTLLLLTPSFSYGADWLGGTGNWSNDLFWNTGFAPGVGEDVWINAAIGSDITFDAGAATIRELRLGNGEDNQVFNIPSGTLTITAEAGGNTPSWSGRWSANTTTRISGTGAIVVSNLSQETDPYYIAGNQGPGGDQGNTQDSQFIVEGNGQLIIQDGGALPDVDGAPTAGNLTIASWREAVASITVQDNGLIDVARDFVSNSGELNLTQTGGTINVGNDFYLDRFDAIDGLGEPAIGTGLLSGGQLNVGHNLHVTESGQGTLTVADSAYVNVTNTLKVNAINTEGGDGEGMLEIFNGGTIETELWEIPTAAQLASDAQQVNISGGLLIVRDSAVETIVDTQSISDNVAGWISSGYLTGQLSESVNADPGLTPDGVIGEIAFARDPVTGYLNIWNSASVAAIAGDYNLDGTVNAADYTVWRDSLGQTGVGLAADGDDSGEIDQLDYFVWSVNYGNQASSSAAATVPEPSACITLLIGLIGLAYRRV